MAPPHLNQTILDYQVYLSAHQYDISYYLYIILSVLSFVLVSFVCATYFLFKNKFPSRLILCMCCCIWVNHASAFILLFGGIKLYTDSYVCHTQGILNQLCSIGNVLWWLCITGNLYLSFILEIKTYLYEKYMHLCCWGVVVITTIAPAIHGIGVVGVWCWISNKRFQFVFYYGPMAISCAVGGVLYAFTMWNIRKMRKRAVGKSTNTVVPIYIFRQTIFVAWFFVMFVFMFAHRLTILIIGDKVPYGLVVVHVIAQSSQGCFVFLIFGMRLEHLTMWREWLSYVFYKYLCNSHKQYEVIA